MPLGSILVKFKYFLSIQKLFCLFIEMIKFNFFHYFDNDSHRKQHLRLKQPPILKSQVVLNFELREKHIMCFHM